MFGVTIPFFSFIRGQKQKCVVKVVLGAKLKLIQQGIKKTVIFT